ncbi:MAG: hypothetical protein KF895_03005 [Parvibaculum sp.]|nr:hypothetical protein [Parvibaculum sp.]
MMQDRDLDAYEKELKQKVDTEAEHILRGSLSHEDYIRRAARRKGLLDALETLREVLKREDDDDHE